MIRFTYLARIIATRGLYYSCYEEFYLSLGSSYRKHLTRIDGSSLTFKEFPERQHFYHNGTHVRNITIAPLNNAKDIQQDII